MFQFGIGDVFGVPTGGNLATPSYPQFFGTLQEASVEFSQKLVELMGQNKFPDDVAPSDMKVTGKAGFARLEPDIYNALYFAETMATGMDAVSSRELHTLTSSPFTATVAITPPDSGTFKKDLGVLYASNLKPFIRDSTTPTAAGHYSISNGTYTFYSADAGLGVLISYVYTLTTGQTLTVTNHLQGYGPVFEMYLMMPYQGTNGLHLYACRSSKMSAPMKRDNYTISDFEFEAFADASGKVFDWFQASA